MAKYDITYGCGHSATVRLTGKHSERDVALHRMEQQDCPECYGARRLREAKAAGATARERARLLPVLLAQLDGSDKQVAWAEDIRAQAICAVLDLDGEMAARAAVHGSATDAVLHFWSIIELLRILTAMTMERSAKRWIDFRAYVASNPRRIITRAALYWLRALRTSEAA